MAQDLIYNDLHVFGNLSAKTMTVPASSVTNNSVSAAAAIAATKLEHQFALGYTQVPGAAIVAATQDVHIVHGQTGEVVSFEAAITGAIATGADRTVNVDLQKSTGAGAFATILTATILLDNTDVLRTVNAATISSANLVDGDILRVIITVAGAAGAQGEGLIVTLQLREDPT